MADIVLNSIIYEVEGEIIEQPITDSQPREKVWHDLRGGLGREQETGLGTNQYHWAEGINACNERSLILAPKITTAGTFGLACTGFLDFQGSTYGYGNSQIKKWNTGTSAWDSKDTSLASPIDGITLYDGTDEYAVVSSMTAAVKSTDGTTWSALTGGKGYLTMFDNRLVGIDQNATTGVCTINYSPVGDVDGTWGSYSISQDVGTPFKLWSGKSLETGEPMLYLATHKGLWTIDFWTRKVWAQEVGSWTPHAYAGHSGFYTNGVVYLASGPGIKKLTAGVTTEIGTDQQSGLKSGYQGYVTDIKMASNGWLVYAVNGSTTDKSSIFRRHTTIGGNQQLYTTSAANNAITCIHISPSSTYTRGRLWFSEGTSIKYMEFPETVDTTQVSSFNYVSSGELEYSVFAPNPGMSNVAVGVRAIMEGATADKKATLYYDIDQSGSYTSLGTFTESGLATALTFKDDSSVPVGKEFKTIKFKVKLETNSSTSTPELVSLIFTYYPVEKVLRQWTMTILIKGDNAGVKAAALETVRDNATLVKFYPSGDETNGTCYYVRMRPYGKGIVWDRYQQEGRMQVSLREVFRA